MHGSVLSLEMSPATVDAAAGSAASMPTTAAVQRRWRRCAAWQPGELSGHGVVVRNQRSMGTTCQ